MSRNIQRDWCILNVIARCDSKLYRAIFNNYRSNFPGLLKTITECCKNICDLTFPIDNKSIKIFVSKADVMEEIAKFNSEKKILGLIKSNKNLIQLVVEVVLKHFDEEVLSPTGNRGSEGPSKTE